jgi:hypothetical protein
VEWRWVKQVDVLQSARKSWLLRDTLLNNLKLLLLSGILLHFETDSSSCWYAWVI